MRTWRNIFTWIVFKPVERSFPAWMRTPVEYDRAIPDDVWRKYFHAWN